MTTIEKKVRDKTEIQVLHFMCIIPNQHTVDYRITNLDTYHSEHDFIN